MFCALFLTAISSVSKGSMWSIWTYQSESCHWYDNNHVLDPVAVKWRGRKRLKLTFIWLQQITTTCVHIYGDVYALCIIGLHLSLYHIMKLITVFHNYHTIMTWLSIIITQLWISVHLLFKTVLGMSLTIWPIHGKATKTECPISQVEFCILKLKLEQASFVRHSVEHSIGDLIAG